MANVDDPTIPVGCTEAAFPATMAADGCYTPEINVGPIVNLYYARPGQPFAAAPTLVELNRRLELAGTDEEQMIGPIVAQVSRAAAQPTTIRVNGVDYDTTATTSYDIVFQDTKDAVYEFARTTQNGGRKGIFYGVDQNGNWYGGQNGLHDGPSTLKVRLVIPADETALQTLTGTLSGSGKFDAKRIPSPVPAVFG
jgi:hypothetical protein